jgi:hypothetical protein
LYFAPVFIQFVVDEADAVGTMLPQYLQDFEFRFGGLGRRGVFVFSRFHRTNVGNISYNPNKSRKFFLRGAGGPEGKAGGDRFEPGKKKDGVAAREQTESITFHLIPPFDNLARNFREPSGRLVLPLL